MVTWMAANAAALSIILRIGLILLLGILSSAGLLFAIHQVDRRLGKTISQPERLKRLRTLLQVGQSIGQLIIALVVGMMILFEFKINVLPILASAGVVGLALSLGAQTFIRDYFAGIVILVENQFTVGDTIKVGDLSGKVERISLRATYLRDLEGKRIIIPNGDIRTMSNLTTEWSQAVINLDIPEGADLRQILESLNSVVREASADPAISAYLLEEPRFQGWIDSAKSDIKVRLVVKTLPDRQWEVAQVLRQHALEYLKET